jgi:hypothetical protein
MRAREAFDSVWAAHRDDTPAGCSSRPSSKAAASEDPKAYPQRYFEDLNDARTMLGERCVLAHRGWAGENRRLFQHPARITSCLLRKEEPGWGSVTGQWPELSTAEPALIPAIS